LIDVIDVPIKDTWAAMEALVAKGKVRSIGVSNFTREKIEELLKTYVTCFDMNTAQEEADSLGIGQKFHQP
jgi:diketogulonate reductase-like aldo/keto reductase